jgi:hypothetical protein
MLASSAKVMRRSAVVKALVGAGDAVLTGLRPSRRAMPWSGWVGGLRSSGRRCPVGPVMDRSVAVVGCGSRPPDRSP